MVTRGVARVNNNTHLAHVECRHVQLPVWARGEGEGGLEWCDSRPGHAALHKVTVYPHPFPHIPLKLPLTPSQIHINSHPLSYTFTPSLTLRLLNTIFCIFHHASIMPHYIYIYLSLPLHTSTLTSFQPLNKLGPTNLVWTRLATHWKAVTGMKGIAVMV